MAPKSDFRTFSPEPRRVSIERNNKLKIALVSEDWQAHARLVEQLEAIGLHAVAGPSLAETLPLFDEEGVSAAALILDSPRQYDSGMLAELLLHRPQLPLLLFDSRGEAGSDSQLVKNLNGFAKPCNFQAFLQPLTDPDSFGLIQGALGRYLDMPNPSIPDLDQSTAEKPIQMRTFHPVSPVSLVKKVAAPEIARSGYCGAKNGVLYTEDFLRRVGSSNVPVLLHGETGVGKEVMARRLWSYSDRAGKPFLKLNCAALPSELIESELFGYEKGAFTGATMDKPGKFELAQNGTILLDEIGDMDIRLQAKLLQVLQDGEIQPLGSSRILSVNVRVMAATHRDLRHAIEQGSFREDLYYRLNVINITVPPLRERRHEILSLAAHLLSRHLPQGAMVPPITEPLRRAMLAYHWPGNIRELENVMRRFLVYQSAELLAEELMGASLSVKSPGMENLTNFAPDRAVEARSKSEKSGGNGYSRDDSKIDYLAHASREAESKLLLETLDAVRWNRRQAAARLNIDYKAFLYKLQKHGIVENKAKRRDVGA